MPSSSAFSLGKGFLDVVSWEDALVPVSRDSELLVPTSSFSSKHDVSEHVFTENIVVDDDNDDDDDDEDVDDDDQESMLL